MELYGFFKFTSPIESNEPVTFTPSVNLPLPDTSKVYSGKLLHIPTFAFVTEPLNLVARLLCEPVANIIPPKFIESFLPLANVTLVPIIMLFDPILFEPT